MFRPSFVGRCVSVVGGRLKSEHRSAARRYPVVFLSKSTTRVIKLASLLSVAGIRVHGASTSEEVAKVLGITRAGVVLIDLETIGTCGKILGELAAAFPDVLSLVLGRCNPESLARLQADGAWNVVVEPARYFDLLTALESAHEMHQELTDPSRLRRRVDTTMMAIRQAARAEDGNPNTQGSSRQSIAGRVLTICVIELSGSLH